MSLTVRLAVIFGMIAIGIAACQPSTKDQSEAYAPVFSPGETVDFEFESSGRRLSGIFDVPPGDTTKALIIIVHSYGETDVRNWVSYAEERRRFNAMGIATVLWDKPGLGRSEGRFDIDQSVHESAEEVLDAAAYLREIGAPGSDRIGLWGGSRAGWIAPLALSQDRSLEFWVSLSGTTAEDNFTYLLLSNLPYEGSNTEEVALLRAEWEAGCELFRTDGRYRDYLEATENLRANEYIKSMRGDWPGRLQFEVGQRRCKDGQCPNTDNVMCDYVWIENFDDLLASLNIDVLALFGDKDLNIDWRKTKRLYEQTIGRNARASLTTYVFEDADHALNKSETGSLKEMQSAKQRQKAEGYLDIQTRWLEQNVLASDP
ncbi:MAG: CocE/NonD family hydrolase [Pseudomonadota bacterium]